MNYLILSLKHSEGNRPCFWRADNAGYTYWLINAGIYPEDAVKGKPDYYNDGYNTLAIPCTEAGLDSIGLRVSMDLKKVEQLRKEVRA